MGWMKRGRERERWRERREFRRNGWREKGLNGGRARVQIRRTDEERREKETSLDETYRDGWRAVAVQRTTSSPLDTGTDQIEFHNTAYVYDLTHYYEGDHGSSYKRLR